MNIKKWNTIAIMSKNGTIGNAHVIPFKSSVDRLWFKTKTHKKIIVFGRKTFENIKVLNQKNSYLVLSKNKNFSINQRNIKIIRSLDDIPNSEEIWICGGEEIYNQTLEMCNFLFLTTVKKSYSGNKNFPEFQDDFILEKNIFENEEIHIQKYKNKKGL